MKPLTEVRRATLLELELGKKLTQVDGWKWDNSTVGMMYVHKKGTLVRLHVAEGNSHLEGAIPYIGDIQTAWLLYERWLPPDTGIWRRLESDGKNTAVTYQIYISRHYYRVFSKAPTFGEAVARAIIEHEEFIDWMQPLTEEQRKEYLWEPTTTR